VFTKQSVYTKMIKGLLNLDGKLISSTLIKT